MIQGFEYPNSTPNYVVVHSVLALLVFGKYRNSALRLSRS